MKNLFGFFFFKTDTKNVVGSGKSLLSMGDVTQNLKYGPVYTNTIMYLLNKNSHKKKKKKIINTNLKRKPTDQCKTNYFDF